jgi:hypothetical protein
MPKEVKCRVCGGLAPACHECEGSGQDPPGTVCPTCSGSGIRPPHPNGANCHEVHP